MVAEPRLAFEVVISNEINARGRGAVWAPYKPIIPDPHDQRHSVHLERSLRALKDRHRPISTRDIK